MVISIVIANYSRIKQNFLTKGYTRITILGYSIPGAVIAVAVMIFLIDIDNRTYGLRQIFKDGSCRLFLAISLAIADRVVVLEKGSVVKVGEAKDIFMRIEN